MGISIFALWSCKIIFFVSILICVNSQGERELAGSDDLWNVKLEILIQIDTARTTTKTADGHFNGADPIRRYRDVTFGGRHKEMLIGHHQFHSLLRSRVLLPRRCETNAFLCFDTSRHPKLQEKTPPQVRDSEIMQIEIEQKLALKQQRRRLNRFLMRAHYHLSQRHRDDAHQIIINSDAAEKILQRSMQIAISGCLRS